MNLSEEAINEFYELWQEDHPGQALAREELVKLAANTLRAFEVVYRPIPADKIRQYKNLLVQDIILQSVIAKEPIRDAGSDKI